MRVTVKLNFLVVAGLVMAVIDHAHVRSVRVTESYCEANLNESY